MLSSFPHPNCTIIIATSHKTIWHDIILIWMVMVEFGVHLWVKAIILLRHVGILPEIWFTARFKIWSWVRRHRCEGMRPKKRLDRKKSTIKFGWLLPRHIGISPDKLLSWRLINFNFVQFFNYGGSSPLELLLLKSNVSIPSKEPTKLGIFPWKWLFAKLRIFNLSKWVIFKRVNRVTGQTGCRSNRLGQMGLTRFAISNCHQLVQACSIVDFALSLPVPPDFGSQPYLLLVYGHRQRVLTLSSSVVCLLATCPDTKKFLCFFQLGNWVFQW